MGIKINNLFKVGNYMLEKNLNEILKKRFNKIVREASNEEIYLALLELTKEQSRKRVLIEGRENYIIFLLNF